MQNAVLREFLPERDVVREERRMRVEDNPAGRYWESLMGVFYEAHPFRIPTIGYPSDIPQLTKRQAETHYRDFYKPNNSILVLAGDLNIDSTLAAVKTYFANIPRGEEFPPVTVEEPPPAGEKRLTVRRADANPRMDFLFHTPGYPHADLYALDVLEGALSGKSGRLYQRLVKEKKVALDASAGNGVDKYTSTFYISVSLDASSDAEAAEKAVWEVLDELQIKPLTDRELQRARNQVAARTERSLEDMEQLATEIAYWEMRNSWQDINAFPKAVQTVEAKPVQEVALRTFKRDAVTVGRILPPVSPASTDSEKMKKPAPGKKVSP
jgi:predicted Zn-dependent peptidase